MDEAITCNTQDEWLANKNNLLGRSPNAILIRNIDTAAAGNNLVVQGTLIKPNTELELKCNDAGGVWNINEFVIGFPDGDDTPFEVITICHTDFYYEEIKVVGLDS